MYANFSKYYDQLHNQISEDIPLLLETALRKGEPILELGCGSGRLLIPMARAGLPVLGIDSSSEMLDSLAEKIQEESAEVRERISFKQIDFTEGFQFETRFNLIIIGFNTLLHLNYEQLGKTLSNCYEQLAPGGYLFIDIINPFDLQYLADEPQNPPSKAFTNLQEEYRLPPSQQNRTEVIVSTKSKVDQVNQTLDVEWIFNESDQEVRFKFHFYYYFPHQLQLLLNEHGYRLKSMWGDYDKTPFDEDGERLILIVTK